MIRNSRKSILFSGSASLDLAKKLAKIADCDFGQIEISKFSDGETYVNIESRVKNRNVFVLQSCPHPTHYNFMELLIIIDAARRLSPKKITALLPFFPYRRQEKNTKRGESITARLIAKMLEAAGADKIFTVDIHTNKILNFFDKPAQNLEATPLFAEYFKKLEPKNLIVMAPDRGALKDVRRLAKKIGASVAWAEKKRASRHDKIESMKFHGTVKNKNILIIDDEINTAGTLCRAAQLLKSNGAKDIYAACAHPVFSDEAALRLKNAPIKEIIATDSINLPSQKTKALKSRLKILSIAPILAKAIKP
jgi:ribose-phosphate pyrophosphokinase